VGTHYFDVTGDGAKDAFVQVACHTMTGGSPDQVEVFDGASAASAPHLLDTLNPVTSSDMKEVKNVAVSGSVVTLSGEDWSANAPECCADIAWSQTFTWSNGNFQAGALNTHSK